MIFGHVADLDVEGTYPNEEILMNISRSTTMMEVVDIEGADEKVRRAVGVNLCAGDVNAVEICTTLMRAPSLHELLMEFQHVSAGHASPAGVNPQ